MSTPRQAPLTPSGTPKKIHLIDGPQLEKTRMCVYFLEGRCRYGDECTYAHTNVELRKAPDELRKTKICELFVAGNCMDPNCNFAHTPTELRSKKEARRGKLRTSMSSSSLGGVSGMGAPPILPLQRSLTDSVLNNPHADHTTKLLALALAQQQQQQYQALILNASPTATVGGLSIDTNIEHQFENEQLKLELLKQLASTIANTPPTPSTLYSSTPVTNHDALSASNPFGYSPKPSESSLSDLTQLLSDHNIRQILLASQKEEDKNNVFGTVESPVTDDGKIPDGYVPWNNCVTPISTKQHL